jgi:hypothetical protein
MSSRTAIAVATGLMLTAIATLYVYWTRTPQYTLLHILDAYATADHQATAAYIETDQPRKKRLHIPRRTEGVIHYFSSLQNATLTYAYRVTVEAAHIEGATATLSIKVGEKPYQLRFEEQIGGRWTLMDLSSGRRSQNWPSSG